MWYLKMFRCFPQGYPRVSSAREVKARRMDSILKEEGTAQKLMDKVEREENGGKMHN